MKGATTFDIAACMIFRDEAQILPEWLEYHLMLGIEHFFLYSNRSQDNYKEVLWPYIKSKQVTLIEWNHPRRGKVAGVAGILAGPFPQNAAYDHAMTRLRGVANWMVVLDSDEFLVQLSDVTLSDFLAQQEDNVAVVVINWAMFGPSGHKTRPEGLIIENYTRRHPPGVTSCRLVKPIANLRRVTQSMGPHNFKVGKNSLGEEYSVVDEHGVRLTAETQEPPHAFKSFAGTNKPSWDIFRINHYWTRSEEEFHHKMRVRGRMGGGKMTKDWYEMQMNNIRKANTEDTYMLKYVPELKQRVKNRRRPYSRLMDPQLHMPSRASPVAFGSPSY